MKLQGMKISDLMTWYEIAGHEIADTNLQDKNARHEIGHENVRLEIAGQK